MQMIDILGLGARAAQALRLNITVTGAANNASTIECWQLDNPFQSSATPGIRGSATSVLGEVANISFTVVPPAFDGGLHTAPFNQWVVFLSGLAYVTVPADNTTSAYVVGGEFGLAFAADTAAVSAQGHRTQFPGNTETVILTIPAKDDLVPEHTVLHGGPCTANEVGGLRELGTGVTTSLTKLDP